MLSKQFKFILALLFSISNIYAISVSSTASNNTTATTFSSPQYIALSADGTVAFITNSGSNSVNKCNVIDNTFTSCKDSGVTTSLLNSPEGIAVNPYGNAVFIINKNSAMLTKCTLTSDNHTINTCANVAVPGLNVPVGVTVNHSGNKIYIVNSNPGGVTKCDLDANNSIVNCNMAKFAESFVITPYQMALNATDDTAYLAVFTNSSSHNGVVAQCKVDVNGILSDCDFTTEVPNLPFNQRSISLNSSGTTLYVVGSSFDNISGALSTNTIATCSIDKNSKKISACSKQNIGNDPMGSAINYGNAYTYIAQQASNTIMRCSIIPSTNQLANCEDASMSPCMKSALTQYISDNILHTQINISNQCSTTKNLLDMHVQFSSQTILGAIFEINSLIGTLNSVVYNGIFLSSPVLVNGQVKNLLTANFSKETNSLTAIEPKQNITFASDTMLNAGDAYDLSLAQITFYGFYTGSN